MDQTSGSNAVLAKTPEHLRWDTDNIKISTCSLATATAGAREILVNFGERSPRGDRGAEMGATLISRIALSPLTARNLAATLRRLIEEYDGVSR